MQAHKISLFLILFENLNGKKMDLKWISCSFPVQPYFIPPKRNSHPFWARPTTAWLYEMRWQFPTEA